MKKYLVKWNTITVLTDVHRLCYSDLYLDRISYSTYNENELFDDYDSAKKALIEQTECEIRKLENVLDKFKHNLK